MRLAAAVICVASLGLLSPMWGEMYSSLGTAARANLALVALAVGCALMAFASTWALQRLTLGLDRWRDVAAPQLAGNAVSNVLPAGSAFGVVVQVRMLRRQGVDLTRAVTSLTMSGLLTTVAGLCIFPVLVALPVGGRADLDLAAATRVGVIALCICVPLFVSLLRSDRLLRTVGSACQRAMRAIPRSRPPVDLADRIVDERDRVRDSLRAHKGTAIVAALGRSVGEYFALYASLLAVGLRPSPPIVLAAFVTGNAAGMIPFTPGGVGFVEAGLGGVLVLAGAPEQGALAGVTIYRLATTWIPVLAGVTAYVWSRRASAPLPRRRAAPLAAIAADVADVALEPASVL